jgi:anti-anti-sigma factor
VKYQLDMGWPRQGAPLRGAVSGPLDMVTAAEMRAEVESWLARGSGPDVRLDLREVDAMDSTALRELMTLQDKVRESGGVLTLVAPAEAVRRLLEVSGLGEHLTVEPG